MLKRLFDITVSAFALLLLAPVCLASALGIWLSSPGPLIYRARRVGKHGELFTMHKFRTMHHGRGSAGSAITSSNDTRVFAFGALLRRLKIDELPQLLDVLAGKMSIVGPRPEDPRIVADHYTEEQRKTLSVLPGLASPGSIYNYTHGEHYLDGDDSERAYVERLLPVKLALEAVYVAHASFLYDLSIIGRTIRVIALIALGRRQFEDPPEMREALGALKASYEPGASPVASR